jgi:hypothetical protein
LFHFEAKITKSKRSEKFKAKKAKKAKKSKKMRKIAKKREKSEKKRKIRLEFCFVLFCFEAKITQVKRSKKFEAKEAKKEK